MSPPTCEKSLVSSLPPASACLGAEFFSHVWVAQTPLLLLKDSMLVQEMNSAEQILTDIPIRTRDNCREFNKEVTMQCLRNNVRS